jgi:lipopolysaccharide transport system ATP-binding protein
LDAGAFRRKRELMPAAIQVESLGKLYRIGERQSYFTLRDRLGNLLRAPARILSGAGNAASTAGAKKTQIWALRDVTFEVQQGEVVGLVGRNGAGKTTLLKILSRVTTPTTGSADILGRVGSLLEVGTGFHPELTGRENVFLNGAILGMGKQEINRKFDEIVAFAEIADFIDTPIKHYSSGMQMRLAFAVAAHFEPQILLVDEVLAVGDLAFQKKCLGKMDQVAQAGRTIVFVSHQMNQIRRLCQRVLWVDGGRIRTDGPAGEVVSAYEADVANGAREGRNESIRVAEGARFVKWEIEQSAVGSPHQLSSLGTVTVRFHFQTSVPLRRGHHGIALFNADRQLMWAKAVDDVRLGPGTYSSAHAFPYLPLRPGPYYWQVSLWEDKNLLDLWDCLPEMVVSTPNFQHARDEWNGVLNLPCETTLTEGKEATVDQPARI